MAATANTTQEEALLHVGLQGNKGMKFETRVQEKVDCTATIRQVLAISTQIRSVKHFQSSEVQTAITLVHANLAMGNTYTPLLLVKLSIGT
jgi:hypothetical protein